MYYSLIKGVRVASAQHKYMRIDMLPSCRGAMKHLTVGVFHDDRIGRELGKKGTESDIVMFNRKMDEHIFTFMCPVEERLSAKSQIISSIDAAIVAFTGTTRELGETVVMLDSLGISDGIAVTSLYATPDQIAAIIKDEDHEQAEAGPRVGLAMKGAPIEDLKRGSVLCASDSVKTGTTLKLHFEKSPFYYDNVRESAFHAT